MTTKTNNDNKTPNYDSLHILHSKQLLRTSFTTGAVSVMDCTCGDVASVTAPPAPDTMSGAVFQSTVKEVRGDPPSNNGES